MTMETLYEKFLLSTGITTDSREDVAGKMYIAIKGDSFDGNRFVEQVLSCNARYVVTSRTDIAPDPRIIVVEDTLITIQNLAAYHRDQFVIPVIVIGGSNGKTTTKELTAAVLEQKYVVLKTEGNLNNYLGVPKTLLRLTSSHEIAVIEIGANHLGEHLDLMNIVKPTHVLVTNNGLDHLEGFGSPENVRKANTEIYEWAKNNNQVTAFVDASQPDLVQDSEGLEKKFYSPDMHACPSNLVGDFNKINIIAAMKIGETFGVSSENICRAINNYIPSLLRSELVVYRQAEWTVDCYNANPSSMKAAIDSFVIHTQHMRRGFILGGMREMGDFSKSEHQKLVDYVVSYDADFVIFVGEEFLVCNLPEHVYYFSTSLEAKQYLETCSLDGMRLLLKGSRGIALEVMINR